MKYDNFLSKNRDILNPDINLEDLVIEAEQAIDKRGYYIAKNLLTMSSYGQCRNEAINYMKHKLESNENYPHSLRGTVAAGMSDTFGFSKNKSWYIYKHCSFTWNTKESDLQHLLDTSSCLSQIRNLVWHKKLNYGEAIEKDGYITYTSLSLYPNDGGFLVRHEDGLEYSSDGINQGKILHFDIELTHKGTDYKEGGFYIRDKETGEMVDISIKATPSDVLFFDGTQAHEVSPTYGGDLGRIGFFKIPTYASKESRIGLFVGAWPKPKSAVSLLSNKSVLILKKVAQKIIAILP